MAKKKKIKGLSLNKIRSKYGSVKASDINLTGDKFLWLPSASTALNFQLGGGIPYGRILEIFGTESSGKSLVAYDFAFATQVLGGIVLWVDAENVWTDEWANKNSINPENVELLTEISIEAIADWIAEVVSYYRSILVNNEPILLVIDSLAALDTDENLNTTQLDAKAEMGNRAKAIYTMLRRRNPLLTKLGVVSIFINQIRDKVGASNYEDPNTTVGGKAMAFYASLRLAFFGGKQVKAKKKKGVEIMIGREVSVRIKKNKVAPPRTSYKSEIYFTDETGKSIGLSPCLGLYDMLLASGHIEKRGGSHKLYLKGEDKSFCLGEKGFYKYLDDDDNLNKLVESIPQLNTIDKFQEKLNEIDENLFPIESGGDEDEEE